MQQPTQALGAPSLAAGIQVSAQFGEDQALDAGAYGEDGLKGLHEGADQPFIEPLIQFQQQGTGSHSTRSSPVPRPLLAAHTAVLVPVGLLGDTFLTEQSLL